MKLDSNTYFSDNDTGFIPNLLPITYRLSLTLKHIAAAVIKPCALNSLEIYCQTFAFVPAIPIVKFNNLVDI